MNFVTFKVCSKVILIFGDFIMLALFKPWYLTQTRNIMTDYFIKKLILKFGVDCGYDWSLLALRR